MNQLVLASGLLIVGIFLLLTNVGVISLEIKEVIVEYYPFLILLFSFLQFKRAFTKGKKATLFSALFLFSLSVMLCLDRIDIVSFHLKDFWRLWPILIIYQGLLLLLGKMRIKVLFQSELPIELISSNGEKDCGDKDPNRPKKPKRIRGLTIGDVEIKKANWSLEPMNLYNTIGDYFIDFSKAYIPEKEIPVLIEGWVGDVKMIVPDDVPVRVQANVKVGDIRVFDLHTTELNRQLVYESPEYQDASKKLNIQIVLKIGSIRIDRV